MKASLTEAAARDAVERIIAAELGRDMSPGVRSVVDVLHARYGGRIGAILFYGSCLRSGDLGGVLDLYVIVERYRDVVRDWRLVIANAVLPPNVIYLATATPLGPLRAKVSVMSFDQFAHAMRRTSLQTSFWARFCQPAALVYARDQRIAAAIRSTLVEAVATAAFWAARIGPQQTSPQSLWIELFRATYAAEFRAEREGRVRAVYEADAARYDALTRPALTAAGVPFVWEEAQRCLSIALPPIERWRARQTWRMRRLIGKTLTLLRLVKAAFTFEDGIEYICWKIERHSGVVPHLTDWQRRHPILAGPVLAWRFYRRGAFR